jgi:hypothetical protein
LLAEWRSDEECTCDEDAEDEKQAAHILRQLALELKGHMPRTRLRLPAIRWIARRLPKRLNKKRPAVIGRALDKVLSDDDFQHG